MKKAIFIALILSLAAAAMAQTAKLTSPGAGATWALGSAQTIAWTWSGNTKVKLLLFRQGSGNIGAIKTGLQLSAASFAWTVGKLENGQTVPAAPGYSIRIINIADASVLDIGPAFAIAGAPGQPPPTPATQMQTLQITQLAVISPQSSSKSIDVKRPHQGEAWIPLKPFHIEWSWTRLTSDNSPCGTIGNCAGCPVDIWVVPAPGSPGQQKVQLAANKCCGYGISADKALYSGSYDGIVPNLVAGSYVVRVALTANPGFFGDSKPFPVQSTLADDTAVLLPDPMQGQADLALVNAFFDNDANVAVKVRNLGSAFLGTPVISFKIRTLGSGRILKQGEINPGLNLMPNQEQTLVLCAWGGYRFSGSTLDQGRFVPETTRPFILDTQLSVSGDINSNNNWIHKEMCLIQGADIATKGEITLRFGPGSQVTLNRGTSNSAHESQLKWLSPDTFEAELEVDLWNYGNQARSFDCWLYVDKQPGLLVGGAMLQPDMGTTLKQSVKIRLPDRCGDHKLVFIADPKEHDDEPYPNAYINNFVNATLTILCGGTFRGK